MTEIPGAGQAATDLRAAGVVDVENLLYQQAHGGGDLARQCLAAFVWWARRVAPPARVTEMGGYAQPWDRTYRAVVRSAGALRFALRPVPGGRNEADRAVCSRLATLTERGCSTFIVGGVDHLVLTAIKDLQDSHDLGVWIVVPTSHPRQFRVDFEPDGKHRRIRARGVVWIDEVLDKYLGSQRNSRPVDSRGDRPPSPLLPSGRFWSPLMPQNADLGDYGGWTERARRQFAMAGFKLKEADALSEALWIGLHTDHGMAYTGRDPLTRRDWAKICLATLFRAALSGRDDVSPHVLRFCDKALESGYRHVEVACEMAMAGPGESADHADGVEGSGPGEERTEGRAETE